MKATGITKKIDNLGRIVIPKELLSNLNINPMDLLEIFVEGDNIIFKKYEESCIFCGNLETIQKFKDKPICKNCQKKVATLN